MCTLVIDNLDTLAGSYKLITLDSEAMLLTVTSAGLPRHCPRPPCHQSMVKLLSLSVQPTELCPLSLG